MKCETIVRSLIYSFDHSKKDVERLSIFATSGVFKIFNKNIMEKELKSFYFERNTSKVKKI
jgi:hypothetical protein